MKKNYLFLSLFLVAPVLSGCVRQPNEGSNSSTSITSSETSSSSSSESSESSSTSSSSSSSSESSSQDSYIKDECTPIALGEKLPIGNKVIEGPGNINNPDSIANEKTYNMSESLPTNWPYISGNNKINPKFYAKDAGGGVKFSKRFYGLQSSAFTPYKYVDVKFKVSSVNNADNPGEKSDTLFHVYGYDKNNNCILKKEINQGAITGQSKNKYVEFTVCNDSMTYFELRIAGMPYVTNGTSTQYYNFGLSECLIKGRN